MSRSQSQTADSPAPDHRASPKRKLDAFSDADDDDYLVAVRMRREGTLAASSSGGRPGLHFFVRTLSGGRSIVMRGEPGDTVESVHERLQLMTGIPAAEQRFIYNGRQLAWEQTLEECGIERDAVLHLVSRMRSTKHPEACQLTNQLVSYVSSLCRSATYFNPHSLDVIANLIDEYFKLAPKENNEQGLDFFRVFVSCSGPAALVMLYLSPRAGNRQCADICIRHFLCTCKTLEKKPCPLEKKPCPAQGPPLVLVREADHHQNPHCLPVVFEFCKLLRQAVHHENPLYRSCRTCLAALLGFWFRNIGGDDVKELLAIPDLFLFVRELASTLCKDLESNEGSSTLPGLSEDDVNEFSSFLIPLLSAIVEEVGFMVPMTLPLPTGNLKDLLHAEEIVQLHAVYTDLLVRIDKCLLRMEEYFPSERSGEGESSCSGWSQHLVLLMELNRISKLYKNAEDRFWGILRSRRASICTLIVRFADRSNDHQWLLQHNDITDFQSRRHLVMLMFPELKEDYDELHEMLIDRSNLLPESFEYIRQADRGALRAGLFMEFKNEEATGPGVLREWFFLVVQAIFNQHNALFVACPNDRRRFYPNPASEVDPLHLQYFAFSGRVIALALMHKVQVGVIFDRVFYLQLAGKNITLDDIQDADPWFHSSCKQILELEPEFMDSDALGLTFVREVEELGSIKVVELCAGGKNMIVNSRNREEYVNLLIRHRFVTSISDQVFHFAQGFADILSNRRVQLFFQSLEHRDLDRMLYGSEGAVCVEDWKAHTEYNGYNDTDPQILWFWQIVGGMSAEQRKVLLFFWTSIKHLPVEGFCGLASRVYIYKSLEPVERLPSSHTCFYRLCFPPYPSFAIMKDRLNLITQEHVGCSFGTW